MHAGSWPAALAEGGREVNQSTSTLELVYKANLAGNLPPTSPQPSISRKPAATMSGDGNDGPGGAAASADRGGGGGGNRKRRMSKRERRNLKKKRLGRADSAGAPTASGETSAAQKEISSKPSAAKDSDESPSPQKAEPTLEEYMMGYTAPPAAKHAADGDDSKSLGKWFPKASVIKSGVCYSNDYLAKLAKERKKEQKNDGGDASAIIQEPKASLVLFYQYVNPTWSQAKVSSFLSYLTTLAKKHRTNIGGRIRVSTEGVNATVSAASTDTSSSDGETKLDPAFEAAQTLRHFAEDLRQFDPVAFADTDFKFIDGLSADRHFKELKLLPVKELVFYGIREEDCAVGGKKKTDENVAGGKEIKGGVHLDAKDYHEMLKRKDAVVIDVR